MPPDQKAFQIWSIWLLMLPVSMLGPVCQMAAARGHSHRAELGPKLAVAVFVVLVFAMRFPE
jgi:hypothetical protein